MKKKIVAYLLAITAVLCFIVIDAEAKKPEIIRYDAQYLDRQVSLNLQWQSSEAIVSVRVAAGKEVKEIKIDAFENKKTRSGYSGEVNVALQTDPIMFQDSISYTLQVEDEDGQKSNLVTGKVAIPVSDPSRRREQDQWGKDRLTGTPQSSQKDMIDQVRKVASVLAAPPVLADVSVNNPGSCTVTFKTKATHSVGLKEIDFRVFDSSNKLFDSQQILATGKYWEGTSRDFTLGSGNYFVIAQAIDASGSTSPEKKAAFTIKAGCESTQPQTQPQSTPQITDQQPPVTTPVTPPVQPPVELPVTPPVIPPVQPPVEPPVPPIKELLTGTDLKGLQGWTIQEWMQPSTRRGEVTEDQDGIRFRSETGNTRMGIMQTINADVSGAQKLILTAVVKPVEQRLDGTGWQGREAPVAIFVTYTDVSGVVRNGLGSMANPPESQANRMFWHGFYYLDPSGNSQSWNGTKVGQGSWYTYEVDLTSLNPKPKTIHAVGAEGSGWSVRDGKIQSLSLKYYGNASGR